MRAKQFFAGARAELPILIGVVPFGMIYGVLALSAGIPAGATQAISVIIFAGSAQFLTAQLVQVAAPAMVVLLSVAVINLRHALYSASMAPYFHHLPRKWKFVLAYLLTDEAYAVTILHYQKTDAEAAAQVEATSQEFPELVNPTTDSLDEPHPKDTRHWFYLGAGLALWTSWQISTAVGVLLGAVVPESWSLDFTLPLTFIALVVPALKDRPAIAAALSAGLIAVLANNLPYKLGLVLAALVGILVGVALESLAERGKNQPAGQGELAG